MNSLALFSSLRAIFFITLIAVSTHAATKDESYSIAASSMIEISAFDQDSQTYELVFLKYPKQGPFIATAESLANAVKAISLNKIMRSPSSVLGAQYMTDGKIELLTDAQMDSRKSHRRSSNRSR
jgi:hypothetical protein